ncbi:class I SAM-dependent methyltransferase [Shinella pollutisoli]|uniref:Class I SAM-dependent methyltransferase n=1 Tax=Shinella pollutisoli TaxID=2250594 RepID=A0ABV7DFU5_9HYPH|nr:class I SAM-dependent methyltransferase [Shinella pollutisoli]
MAATLDHGALMDRIYRFQRRFGFYDATRKYYLVGRDPMLEGLRPPPGGTVLEIGCGTGRNLVKAAGLYPQARLYGVDISAEMLAAAGSAVARAELQGRVRLALADAVTFDPQKAFGHGSYDRIFISYAVSMIPQWQRAMAQAARCLAPGGELHVADFGDMAELPSWTKGAMYTWLRWYHVTPRPDLFETAAEIAASIGGTSTAHRLHRSFSWISVIRKPPAR